MFSRSFRPILALLVLMLGTGCVSVSAQLKREAAEVIAAQQPQSLDCQREDRCAHPSPLLQQVAEDGPAQHRALILDEGQDALLARIHLLRAARERIDLQTFIFDEDDAGRVILRELLGAARRGVKVRVLMDQLMAMRSVQTLAALAGAHANLQVRLYNPVLGRGHMTWGDYVSGTLCCFRRLNQRMHSKLLLVDGEVALTGGRNYQDDYFDWDGEYNYRDRDVLLSGPVLAQMAGNFETFWQSPRSVPVGELRDVARLLRREGVPALSRKVYQHPERARLMHAAANDPALLHARLVAPSLAVEAVDFVADLPEKHQHRPGQAPTQVAPSSQALYGLIASTREEVLIQTPYLVLSEPAQQVFGQMQQREQRPRVQVSSNSLAATDAFMVYALSHKYKRRYLRNFGLEIHEYKPFPADAPINLSATGALAGGHWPSLSAWQGPNLPLVDESLPRQEVEKSDAPRRLPLGSGIRPAPLKRAGVRIGLHAKSLVVDEAIGVVGTHNLDPRGDNYNTESAVIIRDAAFARQLAASIRRDMAPANAWTIAPHEKFPILPGVGYSLLKVSENLPVFDLMPRRYAVSWEFMPGPECPAPLPPHHPDFRRCHYSVGSFPEVDFGVKPVSTRILTAFGAWLAPIL